MYFIVLIKQLNKKSSGNRSCFHPGASSLGQKLNLKGGKGVTNRDILQAILQYIWPKDDWQIRVRVVLALSFLLGAKVFILIVFTLLLSFYKNFFFHWLWGMSVFIYNSIAIAMGKSQIMGFHVNWQ